MDINLDRVKNWKLKTTIDIEHAGLQPQKLLSFILKLFLSGFHSHNPSQQKKGIYLNCQKHDIKWNFPNERSRWAVYKRCSYSVKS